MVAQGEAWGIGRLRVVGFAYRLPRLAKCFDPLHQRADFSGLSIRFVPAQLPGGGKVEDRGAFGLLWFQRGRTDCAVEAAFSRARQDEVAHTQPTQHLHRLVGQIATMAQHTARSDRQLREELRPLARRKARPRHRRRCYGRFGLGEIGHQVRVADPHAGFGQHRGALGLADGGTQLPQSPVSCPNRVAFGRTFRRSQQVHKLPKLGAPRPLAVGALAHNGIEAVVDQHRFSGSKQV